MGLKTPVVNGARQDLPCLESPEVNGARQSVASVKVYIEGAWTEIWSAVKTLILTLSKPREFVREEHPDGKTYANKTYYIQYMFEEGTQSDFTWITEEKSFTNPTISFYCGGTRHEVNSTANDYTPADMYIVGIDESGAETVISVGKAGSSGRALEINYTLKGTYKQVGIRAKVRYSSPNYTYIHFLYISTVIIDGKEYIV